MDTAQERKSQRNCCAQNKAQQQTTAITNNANTHSVGPTKPVQGTTPKSNTNGWNTHRSIKTMRAATYTLQTAPAPLHT